MSNAQDKNSHSRVPLPSGEKTPSDDALDFWTTHAIHVGTAEGDGRFYCHDAQTGLRVVGLTHAQNITALPSPPIPKGGDQ